MEHLTRCVRRGDLATYLEQAALFTTKGFSFCGGGESLARYGKMHRRSSARCARASYFLRVQIG